MGIFGENLIGNITGLLSAIGLSLLVGAWYGNGYGPSAWKLASAEKDLAATNKALKAQKDEDAVLHAKEQAEEKLRAEDFAKADVQKLPVNKSTAEALNKLSGG